MNINKLFEKIQDTFDSDNIIGEFTLQGNCIVWEHELDDDCDEQQFFDGDDDEFEYCFNSESPEEHLINIYNVVVEQIEGLIDELDENDCWVISESDINDNVINFKIY